MPVLFGQYLARDCKAETTRAENVSENVFERQQSSCFSISVTDLLSAHVMNRWGYVADSFAYMGKRRAIAQKQLEFRQVPLLELTLPNAVHGVRH